MWHEKRENKFSVFGQASLLKTVKGVEKTDEDSVKKALTDAITKGLSYLGFNADVFLGKFDDNKYVQSLHDEKKQQSIPKNSKSDDWKGPLNKTQLRNQDSDFRDQLVEGSVDDMEILIKSPEFIAFTDQAKHDFPGLLDGFTWQGAEIEGIRSMYARVRAEKLKEAA
jgi:hypothetical protein